MHYDIRWVYATALLSLSGWVQAAPPAGWVDMGFSGNGYGGEASYAIVGSATNITVNGSGDDIWGNDDRGRFVFQPLAGDCEIMATIPAIAAPFGEWARVGLMMRGSIMANAANISVYRTKGGAEGARAEFSMRQYDGWNTENAVVNFAPGVDARLRFVRQGNLFTSWGSTNAPAYDQWIKLNERTQTTLFGSMNVGLLVSRWWGGDAGRPDILTVSFGDVKARNLVTATVAEPNVSVEWIDDPAVAGGTVAGYAVERAAGSGGAFTALGDTAAGVVTYSDATASAGVAYLYRVYAKVDVGGVTNNVLVGTSLVARRSVGFTNPAAPAQGLAVEYYQPRSPLTLVSARVDPNIDNPWFANGALVFPANASSGLAGGGDPNDFQAYWTGTITPPESGVYGFVQSTDDDFYMWFEGLQIMSQPGYRNMTEMYTTPVWMEAGRRYPIRIEFAEGGGGQEIHLKWFKGAATPSIVPQSALEPFPQPWQHRDVGDSPRFGNAVYDYTTKAFTLTSGGMGINPATGRDDGHFAWQSCATDFDLAAKVTSLTGPAQPGMAAGLSVRSSNADNAASVSLVVYAATATDRVLAVAVRETDGGLPSSATLAVLTETPVELRLTRRGGNMQTYYRTANSGGWVSATNITTSLTGTLNAGLTVFSGDVTQTATGVFDAISFFTSLGGAFNVTVASHEATVVNTAAETPMKTRQLKDALANVEYYWADALNGDVNNYTVYRSDRPDQLGTALGDAPAPGFTYTDPIPAVNTLYFYRMQTTYKMGALAGGGANDLLVATQPFGISDGSVPGSGTGLYAAFYRDYDGGEFAVGLPKATLIRDPNWDKGGGTPIAAAGETVDGVAIGPDNFIGTWSGWILPPYTGYYWLRMRNDDGVRVWVNGNRVIDRWGWTADPLDYGPVWLEAGKRAPIYINFQQGEGGGYILMWWKTGLGLGGDYVSIPTTQLYPLAAATTPKFVAPGSANEFGQWRNIDINTGCPGHAILAGTPTAFDCKVSGGGDDIWNNADGFHFVYQEMPHNFELEATVNVLQVANEWSKVGLMVRDGTNSNARNIFIVQSGAQGRQLQLRGSAGAGTDNIDTHGGTAVLNQGSNTTPVTFKILREQGKIRCYVDGRHVAWDGGDFDISGWSKTLCVGIAVTSHSNGRTTDTLLNNVKLKVNYNPGTLLSIQ